MEFVDVEQVKRAQEVLRGVAVRTPVELSRVLSEYAAGHAYLKCENLQRTGSFKIRGAYNRISNLSDEERASGVVAASAGNHAQGVALAASLLGVQATVFMPESAPLPKVEATNRYGATVQLEGSIYDESFEAAQEFAERSGAVMIHPFDHPDVIAGQGTIALEILEQLDEVGTIVVGIGGGGLISGIATVAKALSGSVRVVGVEPEGAAGMRASLDAGHLVELPRISTVADGLAAKQPGELTLSHVQKFVDEVVTVSDDEIAQALLLMAERAKLVVEPAGAASVAAVMFGKTALTHPVVALLSGGNIDPMLLMQVIRYGMGSAGRYFSFRTRVPDRPGQLHLLLGVIAGAGANIVGVEHHREGVRLRHLGDVEIVLQVETRGLDHVKELTEALTRAGYEVERL